MGVYRGRNRYDNFSIMMYYIVNYSREMSHIVPVNLTLKDLCITSVFRHKKYECFGYLSGLDIEMENVERHIMKHKLSRLLREGRIGLYKLERKCNNGMCWAASIGNLPLVIYFINKGAKKWNRGMCHAIYGGHLSLIKFFISRGADDWSMGIFLAAENGNMELVDFFIEKGATTLRHWDAGLRGAAKGGHRELVEFFISKGAKDLGAARWEAFLAGNDHLMCLF